MATEQIHALSSKEREALFVRLAKGPEGTTAQAVFEEGRKLGDSVTVEAYHNLGRRLVHRAVLVADRSDRHTRYRIGENGEGQWLDEDQIASIVDPEYPLIALTILQESARQLNSVPETAWVEIRERLKSVPARYAFVEAICGYCQNLRDEIENYAIEQSVAPGSADLPRMRQKIQNELSLLKGLTQFGLGLSIEAVNLPVNFEEALGLWREAGDALKFYEPAELESQIARRVEDGPLVRDVEGVSEDPNLLVAAIDGSSRSGLLAPEGEQGDFTIGSYPLVSINTSVAQINRTINVGKLSSAAFFRLPEKPEDMQQSDNRHTIMAKFFYPDITDGEYIHSVWNAMDVLETKATLRATRRWYTSRGNVEVRAADVVLRDGTVVPQERDFAHYVQRDSYGKIARDLIEINWEVVKKCRDDGHTVAGVVKNANLRVFCPVINFYVCRLLASAEKTQIASWPLQAMNIIPDQAVLSRLLTAQRDKDDGWCRTAVILRPFHAVTKWADQYSKKSGATPPDVILERAQRSASGTAHFDRDASWLRSSEFRGDNDSYVQMLRNCWYPSCYVGCVPRLDLNNVLPRCEFILPARTGEDDEYPQVAVQTHLQRLLIALKTVKFDVSADHSMFQRLLKIDILPSLLIRVHETVKIWATELAARVNEYIGFYVSRHVGAGHRRGVRVRPWTAKELESFARQLQQERALQAGARDGADLEDGARPELNA